MIKDGIGGANTKTGLAFEGKTDLSTFLGKQKGYKLEKDKVYYKDELVARVFKKHQFYTFLVHIIFFADMRNNFKKITT